MHPCSVQIISGLRGNIVFLFSEIFPVEICLKKMCKNTQVYFEKFSPGDSCRQSLRAVLGFPDPGLLPAKIYPDQTHHQTPSPVEGQKR
jgi:hypothetical protein